MSDELLIEMLLVFIRIVLPVIGILSLVLFLRPKLFTDLEKKLSKEIGSVKSSKKTVALLEKQNMVLHNALQRNNRLVGLLCCILTVAIIVIIYPK
jgi:hypothetical protein